MCYEDCGQVNKRRLYIRIGDHLINTSRREIDPIMSTQPQAFCLKLNSHQAHVIDQFQRLYNEQLMCDCTLSCSDGTIKAHKLVLSACSPYFTSLFTQYTQPYQYPVIILKDMSIADLRILVELMYKGEVTVSQNILPLVLESAKALQITGLREIKIANQESKQNDSPSKSNKRKKRKHRATTDNDSTVDSDVSEVSSDNDENKTVENQSGIDNDDDQGASYLHEPMATEPGCEMEQELDKQSPSKLNKPSLNSSQKLLSNNSMGTPAQTYKQNLRQLRIEKTQATTGNLSGRKMWTEEETKCLVKIWEEESERVWASAGKKVLSLQRISDLLIQDNVDRDVSQVEGKIKALKRDYKQIKFDKAIPAVQQRMAPYLEKLEKIFSKEEL